MPEKFLASHHYREIEADIVHYRYFVEKDKSKMTITFATGEHFTINRLSHIHNIIVICNNV